MLTNPCFYTPIEENDQVLVVGKLEREGEEVVLPSLGSGKMVVGENKKYTRARAEVKEYISGELRRRIARIGQLHDIILEL